MQQERLHLTLDPRGIRLLNEVKAVLFTDDTSEIIRREILAYRFFEPDNKAKTPVEKRRSNVSPLAAKEIVVTLPLAVTDLLRKHCKNNEDTLEQVLIESLRMFYQLVRDTNKLAEKMDRDGSFSPNPQQMLTLLLNS